MQSFRQYTPGMPGAGNQNQLAMFFAPLQQQFVDLYRNIALQYQNHFNASNSHTGVVTPPNPKKPAPTPKPKTAQPKRAAKASVKVAKPTPKQSTKKAAAKKAATPAKPAAPAANPPRTQRRRGPIRWPRRDPGPPSKFVVYVANVPTTMTESDFQKLTAEQLVPQAGAPPYQIQSYILPSDRFSLNRNRGYGLVDCSTTEDQARIIADHPQITLQTVTCPLSQCSARNFYNPHTDERDAAIQSVRSVPTTQPTSAAPPAQPSNTELPPVAAVPNQTVTPQSPPTTDPVVPADDPEWKEATEPPDAHTTVPTADPAPQEDASEGEQTNNMDVSDASVSEPDQS